MIKIKKINIKKFGIIKDFELELGHHNATIIFGNNESGKTMILDAVLDALFSVNQLKTHFACLNKYIPGLNSEDCQASGLEERENILDGTVALEIDNSQMIFPQEEPLDKIISIPSIYARNLFVVREGEIDISNPDDWWSSVKNRLSGDAGDYKKIADNIRDIVGLGHDGEWINKPGHPAADFHEQLSDKLSELKAAKNDIRELAGWSKQRSEIENKLQKYQEKLDEQKKARKAFLYLEGKNLVSKYGDVQKKSIEFEKYRDDKLKIWHNTETEILKAKQILELSRKHRDGLANLANKNIRDVDNGERKIVEWENLEKEVIPVLETKLVDYKHKETKLQRGSTGSTMLSVWIILCTISSLSITYVALTINPVFFPVAGILYIALGFSVKMWWSSRRVGEQLQILEHTIKDIFKRIDNEDKNINDINSWLIENRNINQSRKKKTRLTKEGELPDVDNITKELSSSINTLESKLQKLSNYTNALKLSSGCSSWENLQKKCNEKETMQVSLNMLSDQINQLLGTKFEEEWDETLFNLEPFASVKIEWNEKLMVQLDEFDKRLNEQLKTLNDKIAEIKINIAKLGCQTHEDLWTKEDGVRSELARLKTDRDAALIAVEIIENVSQEQDKIVNNVISNGEESAANLFSAITAKRYKEIFLDKNNIYAKSDKGDTIPVNHLSSGARAQLYFALRINLAQSLLREKTAFLLLDDPFLTCDKIRTNEMINILQEITEKGWQLVYFTISENIIKMFEERFKGDLNICRL